MADTDAKSRGLNFLLVLLLAAMAYMAYELIFQLREHQVMAHDRAEIRHVKYGMLNADNWVQQVSAILEKKIREIDIDAEQRATLKKTLEKILDTFITEADRYLRARHTSGDWWDRTTGSIKESMRNTLMDVQTVKAGIPGYADKILEELDKPETRQELSSFLAGMVSDISQTTFGVVDASRLSDVPERYDCGEGLSCLEAIEARMQLADQQSTRLALMILASATLMLLAVWAVGSRGGATSLLLLSLSALVLLLCGVLTPMIEVEAQISDLRFMLMGEPIVFTDEVFYFQSKSVLDVVTVLTSTGQADMIFVGILIMTFSVLFPALKLLSSVAYIYDWSGWRRSRFIRFFALKSGKWSMADVMVVAMFMAYIGFSGLISSQLDLISKGAATAGVDVLTTNGTELQIGFFMFLAFCMASMLTSSLMESALEPDKREA